METNEIIETQFHCDIFWHLDGLQLRIYLLASKIAHESGRFFPGKGKLAEYFDRGESTVSEACKGLTEKGFLEVIEEALFVPTVYRPIGHDEWAKRHPNSCCQKETLVWTNDPLVDPLAQKFYSISGGRIKFRENDMKGLQKLNLPDEILVQKFSDYFEKKWPNYPKKNEAARFVFAGKFVKHMKKECTQSAEPMPLKGRAKLLAAAKQNEFAKTTSAAD